ncbi:MAG: hypothetical protein WCE21_05690 [Candidatus Babeliales bacterium]
MKKQELIIVLISSVVCCSSLLQADELVQALKALNLQLVLLDNALKLEPFKTGSKEGAGGITGIPDAPPPPPKDMGKKTEKEELKKQPKKVTPTLGDMGEIIGKKGSLNPVPESEKNKYKTETKSETQTILEQGFSGAENILDIKRKEKEKKLEEEEEKKAEEDKQREEKLTEEQRKKIEQINKEAEAEWGEGLTPEQEAQIKKDIAKQEEEKRKKEELKKTKKPEYSSGTTKNVGSQEPSKTTVAGEVITKSNKESLFDLLKKKLGDTREKVGQSPEEKKAEAEETEEDLN